MTDKETQIKDGRRAKEILEDPLLIKSYEVIQNDTFQKWIRTDIEETNKREALYHSIRGTLTSQSVLVNTMESGKLAEEELKGGK
tara:strand:+ start:129 stop:383 length:255 start_codon:yes stop_codon:yes gene_type:complete